MIARLLYVACGVTSIVALRCRELCDVCGVMFMQLDGTGLLGDRGVRVRARFMLISMCM